MKITADDRKAIPAEANAMYEPCAATHVSLANTSATTVGIVDWKTIAPVMLPIASVSLPWRTQMIELNFSGSSVAIGAMTRASSTLVDAERAARCSTASTKTMAPSDDQAERDDDLDVDDPQPRHGRVRPMRGAVEPVEAQRREVRGVDRPGRPRSGP